MLVGRNVRAGKPIVAVFIAWLVVGLICQQPLYGQLFEHKAKVLAIEDLTHDTKLIRCRLADSKKFRFAPGQYIFLKVPDDFVKEWNARYKTTHTEVMRPYSFASSSSKLPVFDLIIKLASAPPGKDVPPGIATTYVFSRLKFGDVLEISQPFGELSLRKDTGRPIVIVAGGTGAAPFVSLLEYWFERKFDRRNEIFFYFGVRAKKDLFYHEKFLAWAKKKKRFHYIPALSKPDANDNWTGETGFIQKVVEKYLKSPSDADAYLAGPPIMVTEAVKVLTAKGITKDRIHYDEIEVK
jgi:Na+-transporting NADH:ubiquinone oxidoreductase subunit F